MERNISKYTKRVLYSHTNLVVKDEVQYDYIVV